MPSLMNRDLDDLPDACDVLVVGAATSIWWIVAWAIVGRIGLGFVLPSLNLGSMRGLPDELISQGASTINFMRQLGGA